MTKKEWLKLQGLRAPYLATDEEATPEWQAAIIDLIDGELTDKLKAALDKAMLEGLKNE